jgi:predicted TIM-barrel fold metal-dependent hydrolase
MLIDAHNHLPVISETRTYEQARDLFVCDLERHGTDYAILIPDNVPGSNIGDMETCLALTEGYPQFFLLGTVDVETHGPERLAQLEALMAAERIVGMKIFPGHDPIYPTDPRLDPYYALCQRHGLPMMIHTGINPGHPEVAQYNDPKYIVQIAQRYPELPIVIAHYFWPEVDYCYEVTRGFDNIYFDTSGLADDELVEETGADAVQRVVLASLKDNPRSIIFGTDYAMCDRQQHIGWVNALPITDEARDRIFSKNAVELFRLHL